LSLGGALGRRRRQPSRDAAKITVHSADQEKDRREQNPVQPSIHWLRLPERAPRSEPTIRSVFYCCLPRKQAPRTRWPSAESPGSAPYTRPVSTLQRSWHGLPSSLFDGGLAFIDAVPRRIDHRQCDEPRCGSLHCTRRPTFPTFSWRHPALFGKVRTMMACAKRGPGL